MKHEDIRKFNNKIPNDVNLELNISCPNVNKEKINNDLELFLKNKRKWCIIKLSPYTKMDSINNYYKKGFRQFHCCNTIPIKEGGLSGQSLIKYSTKLIQNIKSKYPDTIIIGGGGIINEKTIQIYKNSGADHVSVSTLFFCPYNTIIFYIYNIL